MRFLELFQKEILSFILALASAGILYLFRSRAKLLWATPHGFTFFLQNPNPPAQNAGQEPQLSQAFNIHTGSMFVVNAGRVPATEVEVTFNYRPDNYNIWPVRPFDLHVSPDNRFTLKFSNLAPKEQFQIELISAAQLPAVLSVRCKECVGREISMRAMVVFPRWLLLLLWSLVVLGATAVIYVVIKIISLAAS